MAKNKAPRRSFSQYVFAAIAVLVILTMILSTFRF